MKPLLSIPGPAHRYPVEHAERLRRTFHALTGRDLIDPTLSPEAAAEALFHAPFVVLSHNAAADPILTYGNRAALELFELLWEELTQMPSRLTAEAPDRAERARLLAEVTARGFIDDYSGYRRLFGGADLAHRAAVPDPAGDGLEPDRRPGPALWPGRNVSGMAVRGGRRIGAVAIAGWWRVRPGVPCLPVR